MKERGAFGSKFGIIAAAAGSAIGLGNIWRFPYIAGANGGAAFILIYLAIVLVIGLPMMLSEFSIGRYTNRNPYGAFRRLSPKGQWYLIGVLGIATALTIISFYSVVAGWTMDFIARSVTNSFKGQDSAAIQVGFDAFVASGWKPIGWALLFVAATGAIVISGIEKGIERYNKILMPLMALILVGMGVYSFSLDGFREGITFLFRPDFSKIDGNVVLEALGQAFFSLSLGMGTMITYGSYINNRDNMFSSAASVALSDTLIALLAGVAIFPAVFTFGISPTSGPDLVFITLPAIFQQMVGGYFLSVLFFLLLFIAAVTSSVSLMEVMVAFCAEEFGISRRKAGILCSSLVAVFAILCALSQVPGSALTIGGVNLFDLFDQVSASYMLPIGALFIMIFTGWVFSRKRRRLFTELTTGGKYGAWLYPYFLFVIRFVAPIVISLIFLSKAGLLKL
jgi:NSS family neurotransmitter:Na+ symporter